MSPQMTADYSRWCAERQAKAEKEGGTEEAFAKVRADMIAAFDACPEEVTLPYHLTPEGDRMARFKAACEPEFLHSIDRTKLSNPEAFDRVAKWDGSFPGPLAVGKTATAKTRAAWSAVGRLYVKEGKSFRFFTSKKLLLAMQEAESRNLVEEFWRQNSPPRYALLIVDDADKINWDFESEASSMFQFYDWVYRAHIACVTTTNRDKAWWLQHAGPAMVSRLFGEAHREVKF